MDVAVAAFAIGTVGFGIVLLRLRRASKTAASSASLRTRKDFQGWPDVPDHKSLE